MKRAASCLLTALLTAGLCLATSCAPVGDTVASSDIKADAMNEPYGSDSEELVDALKNSGEVEVYWDSNTFSDKDTDFLEYFSKYYSGSFVRKYCPNDDDMTVFLADFYSGNAPDVVRLNEKYWPRTAMRNMTSTTDYLRQRGVLGLDHPALLSYKELTEGSYTYNGRCYAVAVDFVSPAMVAVNEDAFNYCNVRSPVSYYESGTWTGEVFLSSCHEIARTLLNGSTLYACNSIDPRWFMLANDVDPIGFNGVEINPSMTGPAALRALSRCRTYLSGVSRPDDENAFEKGELAMLCGTADSLAKVLKNCSFNWDVLPFPYDSDNTSGCLPGSITAWGIVSNSKNAQGALNFILAYRLFEDFHFNLEDSASWDNSYVVYNDRQQQRILSHANMVKQSSFPYVGSLPDEAEKLYDSLMGNEPIYDIASDFNSKIEEEYFSEMLDIQQQYTKPN